MSSRIRIQDSGHKKREKRKREEDLTKSQVGALKKLFNKHTSNSIENTNDSNLSTNTKIVVDEIDEHVILKKDNLVSDKHNMPNQIENHVIHTDDVDLGNLQDKKIVNLDDEEEYVETSEQEKDHETFCMIDIFDPRIWDDLDSNQKVELIVKGPKRDMLIKKGPKDKYGRRFSSEFYNRKLKGGKIEDRDWLVYSKELDRVFCFCCKMFKKTTNNGQLTNEGFRDWIHFSNRISEHEGSMEHKKNMFTWHDMCSRIQKNQTIDKISLQQIQKEKDHWKNVLFRIVSFVKFLGKHNLAFRGSNEKLYQKSNGNFLGLVEMVAEFDPIIQEHVQRITNDDIHIHYLGHRIQNELIWVLASNIKSEILKFIKAAQYFSVMLDCTPDISHQEQMSLIIRYVNFSTNSVTIEESFLGFLDVNDTTGLGLFDALQGELKSLDLDINDIRGQSYDNGSNMKGKNQGVQRRLLDINRRAFHVSCGSHSLNLMLCDMADTCGKGRDFFGIIQRIYTIFANSNKRWNILKDNVKDLTVKSLSATRWESRIDSVRAIRLQIMEIREALLEVGETDSDNKIRHEAKSLAQNELGDFEFLVSLCVWYEVLLAVNLVSKFLQSKDMRIDVAIDQVRSLISFFKKYRQTGFKVALDLATELAVKLDVEPIFPRKRLIRRKKRSDETSNDEVDLRSSEEIFEHTFFNYIIDQAIGSLEKRFEQYQEYDNIFGFLFTSDNFSSMDDINLKASCEKLEVALSNGDRSDIDAHELYIELKLLGDWLPNPNMRALDILKFLRRVNCLPYATIAYKTLLSIPVTVASAERSFSKLKLLKTYMRSTMTQERLNGLAMISIESDFLKNSNYQDLIEDFVSKNVK